MSSQIPFNPALNFNPISSILQGYQVAGQGLANQATQINNATLNQLNQARIQYLNQVNQGQNLTNQRNQSTLQYAAPQAEANVGLTNAQANVANTTARYFPLTTKAALITALSRQQQAQNNTDTSTSTILNTPEGRALTSQFPQIASALGNIVARRAGSSGGNFLSNLLGGSNDPLSLIQNASGTTGGNGPVNLPGANVSPNDPTASANTSPQQLAQIIAQTGGAANFADNVAANGGIAPPANPQALGNAAPNDLTSTVQAAAKAANQPTQNVNPQLAKKYNSAVNLMTTLSQYGNPAVTFAKYMGPKGYIQYGKDLLEQNPSALNFQSFQKNVKKLGADQITQFFGSSVQPQAKEDIEKIINPQSLTSSAPASAKAYDDLMDLFRQEGGQVAGSVNKADEFSQKFPARTPQDVLNNISQLNNAGTSGKTYFGTLKPDMQAAVAALHQKVKNGR